MRPETSTKTDVFGFDSVYCLVRPFELVKRSKGGRSVTRTRRGDSYMDDPRSELESMLSSSIDAELPFALERKYVPHHV